jgi:D-hydroxyproline dehydrogenase subunit alpha
LTPAGRGRRAPVEPDSNPNRPQVRLPDPDRFEVVIVGGGPAGLTAAAEVGRHGVRTVLFDESAELGGQYYRRRPSGVRTLPGDHRRHGSELIADVRSSEVEVRTGTVVWGAEPGRLYTSDSSGRLQILECVRLLLATGAHERVVPFPGWTLPGVVTAGAALHWARVDRIALGRRVVVAGTGPLTLIAAAALVELGTEVAALVELKHPYGFNPWVLRSLGRPTSALSGVSALATLRRHGVEILQGWTIAEAVGNGRVSHVEVEALQGSGHPRELSVDAVCVSHGFRLNWELAGILGCECRLDPVTGDQVPVVDVGCATSVPGIFAAGEVVGLGGVEAAVETGRRAARGILSELGRTARPRTGPDWKAAAYTRFLSQLCEVPAAVYDRIPDATLVCRCESVTAGAVRRASATGRTDLGGVKALTRAGMGACQGRLCGHTVRALAGRREAAFTPRMPVRPIPMPVADLVLPPT